VEPIETRPISASALDFTEATVTPAGKRGRRGHYYAWGRCGACGEVQLVRRAGLVKRRCIMTPACKGYLAPTDDVQTFDGPVALAMTAFGAVVVEVLERGSVAQ
jgi:hypothetical protein